MDPSHAQTRSGRARSHAAGLGPAARVRLARAKQSFGAEDEGAGALEEGKGSTGSSRFVLHPTQNMNVNTMRSRLILLEALKLDRVDCRPSR